MTKDWLFDMKVKEKVDKKTVDNRKDLDSTSLIEVIDKYINLGVDLDGKKKKHDNRNTDK